ncbi:MAG: C40 family peptidase [Candidatus Riflebacteria bacterium]|nr:C40 family peptidase [Candidatus Riflebacteria bacterium]
MLSRFIGIPFKVGGEDFEGCDCWGLVKLYFKQVLDIDIPDYRVDESLIKEEISDKLIEKLKDNSPWEMIDKPEPNCVVLLALGRDYINHAGVYVGRGQMLHAYSTSNSCIVNIDSPTWSYMVKGYVRLK